MPRGLLTPVLAIAVMFGVLCAGGQQVDAQGPANPVSPTATAVDPPPPSPAATMTTSPSASVAPSLSPSPHPRSAPAAAAAEPGMLAVAAQAATTGSYGATLIDGCQWATWVVRCQNLSVFGNGTSFDNAGCGQPNGCTFGPEFQCTELAQRYAYYAWGEPAQWDGYGGANGSAYQMWSAGPALPHPLIQEQQGGAAAPRRGDVLIFGQGWLGSYWDGNGHVAVISAVGSNYVDIVQENGTSTGTDRLALSGSTVSAYGYTPIIGWLHNPINGDGGTPRLNVAAGPGQQAVFWRGADNHLRETWLVGSSWYGPADLSATWNTAALLTSAPTAVFSPSGDQSVYWRGASGHLWQTSYNGAWSVPVDISLHWPSSQMLLSAPTVARAPDGQQMVFWQGSTGDLWETWLAGGSWNGPADISAGWGGVAPLNSPPSAVIAPDGRQLVTWQTDDGHLWQATYSNGWRLPTDLTQGWRGQGSLASAPSLAVAANGDQVIFWKGTDDRIWEAMFNGTWSGPFDWSELGATSSAPTAAITADGRRFVYWQAPDGHLATATWNGAWNGPADLSATWPAASHLAGAPASAPTSDGSTQLTFWRAGNGHLWEAWYTGVWNGPADLTSQWHSSTLASDPTVAVTPDGRTQLVFWQGTDGHLWEAWYTGVWNGPVDWTAQWPGAHLLASAPTVMVSPDGRQQTVYWRGGEGHLWEAWYSNGWNGPADLSSAWSSAPLLASAPSAMTTSDGTQLVFWQDPMGNLEEAWYSGAWYGPVNWSAAWDARQHLASPPTVVTMPGGRQTIFWRGINGHLWETWWGGARSGPLDWSVVGNLGSVLSSAPSVMTVGGEQMVFWNDAGHLFEAWRGDPWTAAQVSAIGLLS